MAEYNGAMVEWPEPLLGLDDIAAFLQVSRPTLFRWVKKKEIPHVRVGKRIFFRKSEILAWLESKTVRASKKA